MSQTLRRRLLFPALYVAVNGHPSAGGGSGATPAHSPVSLLVLIMALLPFGGYRTLVVVSCDVAAMAEQQRWRALSVGCQRGPCNSVPPCCGGHRVVAAWLA